jgi:hypothetical protein
LASFYLGNVALIGFVRGLLGRTPEKFTILLTKVVYSGIHSGDFVHPTEVPALAAELDHLTSVDAGSEEEEQLLRNFESQLRALVEASRQVNKPIAF